MQIEQFTTIVWQFYFGILTTYKMQLLVHSSWKISLIFFLGFQLAGSRRKRLDLLQVHHVSIYDYSVVQSNQI